MKKVFISITTLILLFSSYCFGLEFEKLKPAGFVNDFAGVLTSNNQNRLEYLLRVLEKKSSIEVVVAILPDIEGSYIEEAAVKLFEQWRIGKKGKDNGLLFIVAVKERKVRIEVGYGLEEVITDSLAGRILDQYTVPYFRKDDFNNGTYTTVLAIISVLNRYYNLEIDFSRDEQVILEKRRKKSGFPSIFKLIFLLFIVLSFFGRGRGRGRGSIFLLPFLFGGFGGSSSGGGFGSGGGSFGGGFGGGFSGGGGAGRSF